MPPVQQWCLRFRNKAKIVLVTCIALAVLVNIVLVRALYSEHWEYISFFKTTKQNRNKAPRLKLEPKWLNQTHIEQGPKCTFYEPNSKSTALEVQDFHYMTVNVNGRLGNQMFKYASLLGIAAQHGFSPFLRKKTLLYSAFQSQRYFHHITMRNEISFKEHHAGIYDCRIYNLTHSKNVTLVGYFQSWKYFHHIRKEVRTLFTFTDDIVRRAKTATDKYLPGNRTLVGVHVRRGDMNTPRELQRGYKVADHKYFRKAFEYFRYEVQNAFFIVVSDSVTWARENLDADDVVVSQTGNAYVDMAILAQCHHTIITSGSFGWWGAYLAGGKTVYFKDYPGPKSWLSEQYNKIDYYPPSWIPM